jgi:hypothetical protein
MPAPVFLNSKNKRRLKSRRSRITPEKCGQSRRNCFRIGPWKGLWVLSFVGLSYSISKVSLSICSHAGWGFACVRCHTEVPHRAEESLQALQRSPETTSNTLFYALRSEPEKRCRQPSGCVARFSRIDASFQAACSASGQPGNV